MATLFLVLFFLYDIFFVFVTPLLTADHDSVMVKVATGGGSSGETLPLVLLVPHTANPYARYDALPTTHAGSLDQHLRALGF